MKKTVFFCAMVLLLGINLGSCTPQPLLEQTDVQTDTGENTTGTSNPI